MGTGRRERTRRNSPGCSGANRVRSPVSRDTQIYAVGRHPLLRTRQVGRAAEGPGAGECSGGPDGARPSLGGPRGEAARAAGAGWRGGHREGVPGSFEAGWSESSVSRDPRTGAVGRPPRLRRGRVGGAVAGPGAGGLACGPDGCRVRRRRLSRRPEEPDSARRRRSLHGRCPGSVRAPSTTRRTGLGSPALRRRRGGANGPGALRRRPRERDATRRATGADRMTHPADDAILPTTRRTGCDSPGGRRRPDGVPGPRRDRPTTSRTTSLVGRPEPPSEASGPGGSRSGGGGGFPQSASRASVRSRPFRPTRTPSAGAPARLRDTACPSVRLPPPRRALHSINPPFLRSALLRSGTFSVLESGTFSLPIGTRPPMRSFDDLANGTPRAGDPRPPR